MCKDLCKKWMNVLRYPSKTFKKENSAKSLNYGAKSVLIAGIITAVVAVLVNLVSPSFPLQEMPFLGGNTQIVVAVATLIMLPLLSLVGWLIMSGIFYLFARAFDGKGTYVSQSHALALINSAFGVLFAVISIIIAVIFLSAPNFGTILNSIITVILTVYNLYVITIALRSVHKYSTAKAVLSWLIPLIIAMVLLFIFIYAFLSPFINVGGALLPAV